GQAAASRPAASAVAVGAEPRRMSGNPHDAGSGAVRGSAGGFHLGRVVRPAREALLGEGAGGRGGPAASYRNDSREAGRALWQDGADDSQGAASGGRGG